MRKKRGLLFLFGMLLVLPAMLFVGCKDKDDEKSKGGKSSKPVAQSISVALVDDDYTIENGAISVDYNASLITFSPEDFEVKLVYSDGTTRDMALLVEDSNAGGVTPVSDSSEDAYYYAFESTLPTDGTTNAGSYVLTFAYGEIETEIDVVVNKAKIDLTSAAWNYTNAFTYDGSQKFVRITGLPQTVTVTYDAEGSVVREKNAGDYTAIATLTFDDANYELENAPASTLSWKINKAVIDMSDVEWDHSELDYNGQDQRVTLENLPDGVFIASETNTVKTNAGEYEAVVELDYLDKTNYELSETTYKQNWKINKISYDLSEVYWNYSEPIAYDGTAKEIKLFGLPSGVFVVEYAGNTAVEAGTYTATVTLRQKDRTNYELIDASQFTIEWKIV